MLKKFGMDEFKPICTTIVTSYKLSKNDESTKTDQRKYRLMIGGLLYLTSTILDIIHSIFLIARFQEDPRESHVAVVKRIFRYLKGTLDYGSWYPKHTDFSLSEYIEADWAECANERKSTSGGALFLGCRLVSWLSKRQDSVSISTTKA